jgi:type IV pilus assembly protein PilN
MVRINLLPPEERIDRNKAALDRIKDNIHYLVVMTAVLGFAIFGSIQEMSVRSVQEEITDLEAESNAIWPQLVKVQKLEAEKTELSRRLNLISSLDRGRLLRVRMLDGLNRRIPEYMWISNMVESGGGSLTLEGVTFSNLVVAEFMNRLEASVLFSDVDLDVAQRGTIEETNVIQFTLHCSVHDDAGVPIVTETEE